MIRKIIIIALLLLPLTNKAQIAYFGTSYNPTFTSYEGVKEVQSYLMPSINFTFGIKGLELFVSVGGNIELGAKFGNGDLFVIASTAIVPDGDLVRNNINIGIGKDFYLSDKVRLSLFSRFGVYADGHVFNFSPLNAVLSYNIR